MLRYQSLPEALIDELKMIAKSSDRMGAVSRACALGIIYGKRAERTRRNKKR